MPRMLREAGISVERHDDHYGESTDDEVWIPGVVARGWIILSHNKNIRYTSDQTDLIMNGGGRMFALIMRNLNHAVLAQNFINSIHKVRQYLDGASDPFITKLKRPEQHKFERGKPGIIEDYLRYEDWLRAKEG